MIRVGPPLAQVGGVGLAVTSLVPAVVHLRRLVTADGAAAAVGGAVPLVVTLAVAGYGLSLARRDTGGERTRAAVTGVVGGTALAALVAAWLAGGEVVTVQPAVSLPVVATHVLTAGLAVGGLLAISAERRHHSRRAARSLFDALSNPAARVRREPDGGRTVVDVNEAFLTTFGPDRPHVGSPLSACLRPADGTDDVSTVLEAEVAARSHLACGVAGGGDGVREFRVSRAAIDDEEEYVVLVDVTGQNRRERRLAVLNRVLRHDLRTAVNVIDGHAATLADTVVDGDGTDDRDGGGDGRRAVAAIRDQTAGLLRLSRRARQLEELLDDETTRTTTDLRALATERLDAFAAEHPAVTVERSLPDATVPVVDDGLLGAAVDEVLANVAEHATVDGTATARVSVTRTAEAATLTVADDGPGIPDTETAVVDRVVESDLDHASGLGLWFVTWVVVELGGDVTVDEAVPDESERRSVDTGEHAADGDDRDDLGGTTVRLHLPLASGDGSTASVEEPARDGVSVDGVTTGRERNGESGEGTADGADGVADESEPVGL
ncbi:ATP-binding protein [Halobaculum sp. MBLA0147]|uniref:ATP-binding protein n=1 Tax=Halobaculum sp. MBLA0147 TaxID=3079934 RepID=UPI003523E27A